MTIDTAAWVCLCAPLVAAVLITLAVEITLFALFTRSFH